MVNKSGIPLKFCILIARHKVRTNSLVILEGNLCSFWVLVVCGCLNSKGNTIFLLLTVVTLLSSSLQNLFISLSFPGTRTNLNKIAITLDSVELKELVF